MSQDEAVRQGVYSAFLDIMDGMGSFPITREAILDAIKDGVWAAVAEAICEGRWGPPAGEPG